MLRALTAYTQEIDEPTIAVAEILEQLDLSALDKNSVGILTCYAEFIESGVVKALCDSLPFEVIGCTTMGCGTNGEAGHLELTLMVLTGDDIEFSVAVSAPLAEEQEQPLRTMYSRARERMSMEPAFIITFVPLMYNIGGEMLLDILDDASHLPIFGTMAVDHTMDYHLAQVIHNGEAYSYSLAMILVGGNVSPEFLVASISEEKALKQNAIITAAERNILQEVNGLPVVEYMASLGLTRDGQIEGPSTIPFIVDFNDGTKPVIRAIFAQTPEGYAVCGGVMPVNSTLAIGSLDYDDVMLTTGRIIREVVENDKKRAVLIFSCVGRNYALGVSSKDEMIEIEKGLGGNVRYQLAYSGGEICPLRDNDGKLKNRFHNDTIVACVF